MGFLEYARKISFEKDELKLKILVDEDIVYPEFLSNDECFIAVFPVPKVTEESTSYLGYDFQVEPDGLQQVGKLFRAAVYHLTAHAVSSNFEDYFEGGEGKDPRLTRFVASLIEDVGANAYISAWYPDKNIDLSFANALALKRIRPIDNIITPATRIMASLLLYANTGLRRFNSKTEKKIIDNLIGDLEQIKEMILESLMDEEVDIQNAKMEVANKIYSAIKNRGPIVEFPSLPHTENLEPCSLFPTYDVGSEYALEDIFQECLTASGGGQLDESRQTWDKVVEAETLQVFDTWFIQKEKEEKLLRKYEDYLFFTRFKSLGFPNQDYTEYLRTKTRSRSQSRRLISSLLVARDALDEEPRKMYGVLDVQEAIQVVASKSPRMDIFMLNEYIDKSYAWVILLDASRSVKCIGKYLLDIGIMLAESAKNILNDKTSWSMYAFNDRFLIIKDVSETYNTRVKSRIGGIKFEGTTYMPDALEIAGQILKQRTENLKIITIISDGWPYGYPNIHMALTEVIEELESAGIVTIGIGAKSGRMEFFFKSNVAAYSLKDVTKKYSNIYLKASSSVV